MGAKEEEENDDDEEEEEEELDVLEAKCPICRSEIASERIAVLRVRNRNSGTS